MKAGSKVLFWAKWKDPDTGKDWRWKEKRTTEDEMAGWHHRLNGDESEWTLGDGDGQGGLACCSPWGRKESDMTERLSCTELTEDYIQPRRQLLKQLWETAPKRWQGKVSSYVALVNVGEHAIKRVYFLEGVCWSREASASHEKQLSPRRTLVLF